MFNYTLFNNDTNLMYVRKYNAKLLPLKTMILFLFILSNNGFAQIQYIGKPTINYVNSHDKVIGVKALYGSDRYGLHVGYGKNWKLTKNKKWFIGFGLQANVMIAKQKKYITAPTKIIKNSNSVFAAAFATQEEKLDTFLVPTSSLLIANFYASVMYRIRYNNEIGISLDLAGVTLGLPVSGTVQSSLLAGGTSNVTALPTLFNYVLLGSNNHGSLLYHLYYQYWITDKFGIGCSINYLYTEYRTYDALVLDNKRYRNISFSLMAGITYAPFHRKTN